MNHAPDLRASLSSSHPHPQRPPSKLPSPRSFDLSQPSYTVFRHGHGDEPAYDLDYRFYTLHGLTSSRPLATMSSSRRTSNPSALRVQAWAEDVPTIGIIPEQATGPAAISTTLPVRSVGTTARSDAIRGTTVTLSIPLDEVSAPKPVRPSEPIEGEDGKASYTPRRKVLRRDSMERREALLKGKEGSRRRQRWENGE